MKKIGTLLVLSIFALSACSNKAIEFEEAENRINKIHENIDFVKNYSFSVTIKNSGTDNKILNLLYETNEKDEKHFKINVKDGKDTFDNEGFKVKDDKYGEITYLNVFNQQENKYVKTALTQKNESGELDLDYEISSMEFQFYTMLPILYFDVFAYPNPFFSLGSTEEEGDQSIVDKYEIQYDFYANSDTDLIMQSTAKLKDENEPKETLKNSKNKAVFDNYIFKSGSMYKETVGGDIEDIKANLTVKDSSFTFTLPTDWNVK